MAASFLIAHGMTSRAMPATTGSATRASRRTSLMGDGASRTATGAMSTRPCERTKAVTVSTTPARKYAAIERRSAAQIATAIVVATPRVNSVSLKSVAVQKMEAGATATSSAARRATVSARRRPPSRRPPSRRAMKKTGSTVRAPAIALSALAARSSEPVSL